jgi:hypothetical protein
MPDLNRSVLSEAENADTLNGLTDVTITAAEEFQGLSYNGTEWVNGHIPLVSYVRNAESNTLTTGTVVYLFGGTGDHASVKRADYTSDTTSSKTIGLVGNPIAASQNGPVITRGYVDGIDLSTGYSVGDVLWLGTNGQFTTTKATAPNHLVFIGVVVRASVNGIVYVATQNGYELDEIHNVAISNTVASGDFLKYNGSVWVNDVIDLGTDTNGNYVGSVSGGTLISVSNTGSEGGTFTVGLSTGTSGQIIVANSAGSPAYVTMSGDVTISSTGQTTIAANSVALGADTTGNYIATIAGTTNEISVSGSGSESATVTIGLPANVTIANNLTVTGDLTVNGNTVTLNTANLEVEDNFILLNSGVTGSPTLNAGIEVKRGTSTNVAIRWNETTDKWQFTTDGTTYTDLGAGGASISDTAPASPVAGQIWFESDTGSTFVYYDSHWIEIGASGMGAYVADTAPTSPISGQIWFNSSNAGTYVYYDSQWIEIGASAMAAIVGDTAPTSPVTGQVWYNSSDGGTYVYYDSVWVEIGSAPFNSFLGTINAKGDLLVGTADNAVTNLTAGTNGYFLKANSSTATGLEWASIPTINSLDDVGDVSVSGVSAGQVLQWNGTAWIGATVSSDVMTSTRNAALIIMDIGA